MCASACHAMPMVDGVGGGLGGGECEWEKKIKIPNLIPHTQPHHKILL